MIPAGGSLVLLSLLSLESLALISTISLDDLSEPVWHARPLKDEDDI
jgi:hypothetical protein